MAHPRPISLRLEGTPMPKPRMTQRDKWMPSKAAQRYFTWANLLKNHAAHLFQEPWRGPIILSAKFFLPVPRSLSMREKTARAGMPHTFKPDLKNLIAGLEDALNGVAWADDAVIIGYNNCAKYWASQSHPQGQTVLWAHLLRGDRITWSAPIIEESEEALERSQALEASWRAAVGLAVMGGRIPK